MRPPLLRARCVFYVYLGSSIPVLTIRTVLPVISHSLALARRQCYVYRFRRFGLCSELEIKAVRACVFVHRDRDL